MVGRIAPRKGCAWWHSVALAVTRRLAYDALRAAPLGFGPNYESRWEHDLTRVVLSESRRTVNCTCSGVGILPASLLKPGQLCPSPSRSALP